MQVEYKKIVSPGVSLTGKKKVFRYQFSQKSLRALHVLNHGWWQLAVGGWRLAVGNWRLVVVGGGWWLAVGGWRRLAVVGSWRLVAAGGWRLTVSHIIFVRCSAKCHVFTVSCAILK